MGTESDSRQAEAAAKELNFTKANLDELAARGREIIELAG
jgi:hypothetical protein